MTERIVIQDPIIRRSIPKKWPASTQPCGVLITRTEPFDINRAASLELQWWIVRSEREKHSPEDLPKLLAETAAVIYHMPHEPLFEHGKLAPTL